MLNKHAQEFVFLGRQLHLLVADLDDAPYEIDRKIANAENRTLSLHVELVAKRCAHPGKELIYAERLGHVIVSPEIQCLDLPSLIPAARQHHDWYAFVSPADNPQQFESLDIWQSE